MSTRGRKKVPTTVAVASQIETGNPGGNAVNIEDPLARETMDPTRVLDRVPDPPKHFNKRAREFYHEFAGYLQDWRCLTLKTLHTVRVLAHAYAELEELQIRVQEEGHVVETMQGVKRNPTSQAYDTMTGRVVGLLSELGMTPTSAAKLKPSQIAPGSERAPKGVAAANPMSVLASFRAGRAS